MNTLPNNGPASNSDGRDTDGPGEATLRLIAALPAPEGLTERVKAGLHAAPANSRILMWPSPLRPAAGWMYGSVARGAAAAAIVFLVAGGGWRIYSHVQPAPAAGIVAMPSAAAPTGTPFSNANATHRPDTVVGPVLTHPVTPVPEVNVVEKMPAQPNKIPNQVYKPKGKKLPSHPVTAPMQ